jgi:hypothetical protein
MPDLTPREAELLAVLVVTAVLLTFVVLVALFTRR